MDDPDIQQLRDAASLLNAVGAVVWEFDWSDGAFIFVTDACEGLLGYTKKTWLEPGFWMKVVHPDDFQQAASYCAASTAGGEDHVFEYRMLHADGRTVWVRDIVIVDPVKRLEGVLRGLLIDITDVKRKAEQFDAVFSLSRDVFFRTDGSGRVAECMALDLVQEITDVDAIGKLWNEVLPREPARALAELTARAHETASMAVGEFSVAKGGATSDWEARVLPLSDGETALVCRNITERKKQDVEIRRQRDGLDRAVVELRASERRFRNVIDRAPTGVHLYEWKNGDLTFVGFNPAAGEILGIDHSRLIGLPIERAFPQGGDWVETYRDIALNGGQSHFETIYEDGALSGAFDVTAFQTSPGEVAVMFFDITERKKIERASSEYNRRMSSLAARITSAEDSERRRLAEELHDRVSQPLAVARLRLSSASGADDVRGRGAEIDTALEMLEIAIAETRTLTTELYPPMLRELGIAAALGWLADDFGRLHGLACETRFDEIADDVSEELQGVLFRVARELLMNVVKHSDSTRAWLSLDMLGDRIALTVSDEGRGFDTSQCLTWSDCGGFGLFSIGERVRYLNGSFDIESARGKGARMTVTVPLG